MPVNVPTIEEVKTMFIDALSELGNVECVRSEDAIYRSANIDSEQISTKVEIQTTDYGMRFIYKEAVMNHADSQHFAIQTKISDIKRKVIASNPNGIPLAFTLEMLSDKTIPGGILIEIHVRGIFKAHHN